MDGELVGRGDPAAQARQACKNIRSLMEMAGGSMSDVVKLTVYVTDLKYREVKSGGINISSLEVEAVLLQHPDVLEVAVVGMRDDYWSEVVVTFVVAKNNAAIDPEEPNLLPRQTGRLQDPEACRH